MSEKNEYWNINGSSLNCRFRTWDGKRCWIYGDSRRKCEEATCPLKIEKE